MATAPSVPIYIALLLAYVGGGSGFGTWLGKTIAHLANRDRGLWGDLGGITGGILGLAMYIATVIAILTTKG